MNGRINFAALMAISVLTGLFFTGCSFYDLEMHPSTKEIWENQLLESMESGMFGEDLSLESYQYLGKARDKEAARAMYDEIMCDRNELPAYRGSLHDFTMETWRDIRNNPCDNINPSFYENYVDSILQTRPGIVELTWLYKGKKFKTKSLVSNRTHQIEYDNVLSHIVLSHVSTDIRRTIVPRMKTRSETETNSEYELAYHYENSAEVSINGRTVGAYVEYTVYGEYNSYHDKSIENKYTNSWTTNFSGSNYTSISNIRVISFTTGSYVAGHLEVSYVYGVAASSNGMVHSFDEVSHTYSLENEEQGGVGHDYIYPYNLTANNLH